MYYYYKKSKLKKKEKKKNKVRPSLELGPCLKGPHNPFST
jgi:hypothetical protein